ncbi:MAG TPA: pitrilysin family protein [Polyangiaceae bacterium]|nr:pitrilysin family protein [Polyangiaceae bacterium]
MLALPEATSPPVDHFKLPNGLDVVIEENHREPHVAVLVSYDIGTRDEPDGYSSLAHLVEHLTFRRSRHLPDYRSFELLERAGCERMNGETHDDRTLYYAVVPSKALPLALWIESERMGFTLEAFDEKAIEHERDVLRAELGLRQSGHRRLMGLVATALYGEQHPYGDHGDPSRDLDDLTLRDTQYFFQRGYRPDNAHLVIVGDVSLADGHALAERYFAGLANPATPRPVRRTVTPASAHGTRIVYRSREYSSLLLTDYRAPPRGTPAYLAARLLTYALRFILKPKLVDQQRVALALDVDLDNTAIDSHFVFQMIPRAGVGFEELESALRATLAHITVENLRDALREARAGLVEHEWLTMEHPLARARAHVDSLAYEGHPSNPRERIQALGELTVADLAPLLATFANPLVIAEKLHDRYVGPSGSVEVFEP